MKNVLKKITFVTFPFILTKIVCEDAGLEAEGSCAHNSKLHVANRVRLIAWHLLAPSTRKCFVNVKIVVTTLVVKVGRMLAES